MKTIKAEIEAEIEIKNSRFITYLYKITDSDITPFLERIKTMHPKATHYCYAYKIGEEKHSSDDGEPGGTAGLPILNVLEKENLDKVLAITVRYFGGIKLGAGGLIRAYTKSVTEALKETDTIELIEGYKVKIEFSYKEEKQINYILSNSEIVEKNYNETITYIVLITQDTIHKLHNYPYEILEKLYLPKENT